MGWFSKLASKLYRPGAKKPAVAASQAATPKLTLANAGQQIANRQAELQRLFNAFNGQSHFIKNPNNRYLDTHNLLREDVPGIAEAVGIKKTVAKLTYLTAANISLTNPIHKLINTTSTSSRNPFKRAWQRLTGKRRARKKTELEAAIKSLESFSKTINQKIKKSSIQSATISVQEAKLEASRRALAHSAKENTTPPTSRLDQLESLQQAMPAKVKHLGLLNNQLKGSQRALDTLKKEITAIDLKLQKTQTPEVKGALMTTIEQLTEQTEFYANVEAELTQSKATLIQAIEDRDALLLAELNEGNCPHALLSQFVDAIKSAPETDFLIEDAERKGKFLKNAPFSVLSEGNNVIIQVDPEQGKESYVIEAVNNDDLIADYGRNSPVVDKEEALVEKFKLIEDLRADKRTQQYFPKPAGQSHQDVSGHNEKSFEILPLFSGKLSDAFNTQAITEAPQTTQDLIVETTLALPRLLINLNQKEIKWIDFKADNLLASSRGPQITDMKKFFRKPNDPIMSLKLFANNSTESEMPPEVYYYRLNPAPIDDSLILDANFSNQVTSYQLGMTLYNLFKGSDSAGDTESKSPRICYDEIRWFEVASKTLEELEKSSQLYLSGIDNNKNWNHVPFLQKLKPLVKELTAANPSQRITIAAFQQRLSEIPEAAAYMKAHPVANEQLSQDNVPMDIDDQDNDIMDTKEDTAAAGPETTRPTAKQMHEVMGTPAPNLTTTAKATATATHCPVVTQANQSDPTPRMPMDEDGELGPNYFKNNCAIASTKSDAFSKKQADARVAKEQLHQPITTQQARAAAFRWGSRR